MNAKYFFPALLFEYDYNSRVSPWRLMDFIVGLTKIVFILLYDSEQVRVRFALCP